MYSVRAYTAAVTVWPCIKFRWFTSAYSPHFALSLCFFLLKYVFVCHASCFTPRCCTCASVLLSSLNCARVCMRIIDYSLAVPLIIWSFSNGIARVCVCDATTHSVHASVFLSRSLCCTVMSFWLGSNNVSILLDIYLIHFHSFRISRASRPGNFVRVIRYIFSILFTRLI